MDDIDRRILRRLHEDGRITNTALAHAVGMTRPAVLERVRRLEESGVIRGYRAQLDPELLGYGLTVLISIGLENAGEANIVVFRDAVAGVPEITECHYVTGVPDFILKAVVRDVADYRRLVMSSVALLPGVQRVESFVVLETFKDDEVPPER